jgi:hypothetical protein
MSRFIDWKEVKVKEVEKGKHPLEATVVLTCGHRIPVTGLLARSQPDDVFYCPRCADE